MSDLMVGHIAHEHHGFVRVPCRNVDGMAIFDQDIRLGPVEHMHRVEGMARSVGMEHHSAMALDQLPPELMDTLVVATRWPGRVVHYAFAKHTCKTHKKVIEEGIAKWRDTGVFRFVDGKNPDGYLEFNMESPNNNSAIGRHPDPGRRGAQAVNLTRGARAGQVAHEIGHALGLAHEQKRRDAPSYLEFVWKNIDPKEYEQYATSVDALRVGYYDFGSIMHYGRESRSSPKLRPLDPNVLLGDHRSLGQREKLAMSDVNAATAIYAEGVSTITVELETGEHWRRGDLYLGIGGREFRLATRGGGLTANARRTFVLGEGAPADARNDPSSPPLSTSYVLGLPVYLRLEDSETELSGGPPSGQRTPATASELSGWALERAKVTLSVREVHHDVPDDLRTDLSPVVFGLPREVGRTLGPLHDGWRVHLTREPSKGVFPLPVRKIRKMSCRVELELRDEALGQISLGLAGREFYLARRDRGSAPTWGQAGEFEFQHGEGPTEGDLQEFPAYLCASWGQARWALGEGSVVELTLEPLPGDPVLEPIRLVPVLAPVELHASCGSMCMLKYEKAPRHAPPPPTRASLKPCVRRITIDIRSAASSVGDKIWLGLGGREFRLAKSSPRRAVEVFVLGEDANVLERRSNDPREPDRVTLLDLETHPTYLRTEGAASWTLGSVAVKVLFEGHEGDGHYRDLIWRTEASGLRAPAFLNRDIGVDGPPMTVEFTGVYEDLPLNGSAGRFSALARTRTRDAPALDR